jgi:hypothetical protein
MSRAQIYQALQNAYTEFGRPEVWDVVKVWLDAH